jgi:predicted metal-dependent hydrolase
MKKISYLEFQVDILKVPAKVNREYRNNARVAFGKNEVLIRLPQTFSVSKDKELLDWAHKYLIHKYQNQPEAFERFKTVNYKEGYRIQSWKGEYKISLNRSDRKTLSAKTKDQNILLELPTEVPSDHPAIGKLMSRVMGKIHLPEVTKKVRTYNEKYFQQPLGKISMRNAATRWGSCSSSKNISLSTRGLLAPEYIFDHIIIHELAHLIEMNHSPAFWKLVKKVDPNYKEKETWLRDNGNSLQF